jgi:hypothetical protein
VFTLHLQRVAKTRRRDKTRNGALALDERVREKRRGMHDARNARIRELVLCEQPLDATHDALVRRLRRRELLVRQRFRVLVVVNDDVGEGAADVDRE